jgi:hypothetical protein
MELAVETKIIRTPIGLEKLYLEGGVVLRAHDLPAKQEREDLIAMDQWGKFYPRTRSVITLLARAASAQPGG